jgi:hypothetical protein
VVKRDPTSVQETSVASQMVRRAACQLREILTVFVAGPDLHLAGPG